MAVSQMEKLSVIGPLGLEEKVLQVMQSLRVVELVNAKKEFSKEDLLTPYTTDTPEATSQEENYHSLLKRVQDVQAFLKRYSPDKEQTTLKRKNITMDELIASYDEKTLFHHLATIEALQGEIQQLGEEKKELQKEEKEFSRWQYLDVVPKNTNLNDTQITIGVLNNQNQEVFENGLKEIPELYQEIVYNSPHHVYYFLLYLKEHKRSLNRLLENVGFRKVTYPYEVTPKEKFQEIKNSLKENRKQVSDIKKQLATYAHHLEDLALSEEAILAMIQRQNASGLMVRSDNLFVLEGWLPTEEKENFLQELYQKVPKEDLVVEFSPAVKGEDIPVRLKNNPLVAPFEMLTEMYSLPKYGEVDPTPLMTPFYLVFFGMMVADLGYGLVMLVGTLLAKKLFVLKRGMARFVDFFFILSFPTMIWGLIYGSLFGASLAEPFPLLSTTEDVNTILMLSVIFGFIQIIVGLIVNSVVLVKKKEYLNAVRDGFAWQGLLVGIVIALLGKLILSSQGIFYIGVVVAVLCALSIVIIPMFQSSSKLKGLAKGAYGLYGLTGYIGDLVSYTRLMALGISGGSIAAAFNMLVGYMPPVARFTFGILLLVGLQALNLFLSLLSAYVHGARLQYVEFFGKFFSGGGRAFKPLETEEKYVNIEQKKTKKK